MLIDDEEFCISAMIAILNRLGINCEDQLDTCMSGEEAIKQVETAYNNKMVYKIICTDFSMPGMDGIEVSSRIK